MRSLIPCLTLALTLSIVACGSVPSHDVDGPAELKNYDRTLYERLATHDRSLYQRLGGLPVIERFVDDGVERVLDNPMIAFHFEGVDIDNLKLQLSQQICQLAGGPCVYEGMDMQSAHVGLDITAAEFNALVEDFQWAMRRNRVPFGLENQVIALLAPMKPAVINQ